MRPAYPRDNPALKASPRRSSNRSEIGLAGAGIKDISGFVHVADALANLYVVGINSPDSVFGGSSRNWDSGHGRHQE